MEKQMKNSLVMALISLLSLALLSCSAPAPVNEPSAPQVSAEPAQTLPQAEGKTVHQKVQLAGKQADGYVIPFRNVKIVCVITDVGMVGCGAFDVAALDSFACPAAKVKSATGKPIATIDDLLEGTVKEANAEAGKLGIKVGMTGREALDLL